MNLLHRWISAMRGGGWQRIVVAAVQLACMVSVCLAGQGEKIVAQLYFADAQKPFLVAEARVMVDPGDPVAFARKLVVELINGSARGNPATVPTGTQLKSLFLLDDGTAVVDFSAQLRENHPGSCRLEQLTLFSVVNTLVLNLPEIDRVKFLIEGAEVPTLTGHLALEFPLTADMLLTR